MKRVSSFLTVLLTLPIYISNVDIFPPQLNHFHNLRYGGVDEDLYRFGLWSESLGEQWFQEADVIIIEDQWLDGWVEDLVASSNLKETPVLSLPEVCRPESKIHLYIK